MRLDEKTPESSVAFRKFFVAISREG